LEALDIVPRAPVPVGDRSSTPPQDSESEIEGIANLDQATAAISVLKVTTLQPALIVERVTQNQATRQTGAHFSTKGSKYCRLDWPGYQETQNCGGLDYLRGYCL
jgi:hypothetical protein